MDRDLSRRILALLRERGALTVREIADAVAKQPHSVYRAVDCLESAGLVERDDDWPCRVWPCDAPERSDTLADVTELLAEAMRLPEWTATPGPVRHRIEHAWVLATRDGE